MYRRFDPVRGFENVTRKMNDFISDIDKGFSVEFGGFSPRVDVMEDDKHLYFNIELPGVQKSDIKLVVNDENVLVLKGEKKRPENENKTQIRIERNHGQFSRSFILPDNIKRDSISAKFEDGILYVTLEKQEPEKPKEVDIKIN